MLQLDGIDVLGDWEWNARYGLWTLCVRFTIAPVADSAFPSRSDWVVLASPRYPRGEIKIHPAATGGITDTHPHQTLNEPTTHRGWRTGLICVETGIRHLGRQGLEAEPFGAEPRLRWNLERGRRWAELAAAGSLAQSGDAFELPDFDTRNKSLAAFSENGSSLLTWEGEHVLFGHADVIRIRDKDNIRVVSAFRDMTGREVYVPRWGLYLRRREHRTERGLWIRLPGVPYMKPWKAPMTWGEVRRCGGDQGVDVDAMLRRLMPGIRDGREHVLLVGFPIAATVGGAPVTMHWQSAVIRPTHRSPDGFRKSEENLWSYDRKRSLADDIGIQWLDAENWHEDTIALRGRLPSAVRELDVFVVGAGALGSALSELLVRGGVKRLAVLDDEALIAGNLARHTLTLDDVGANKADGLADRLNAASPHASVCGFSETFPPRSAAAVERLRSAELIIDTTGEDNVLAAMESYAWNAPKLFWSVSLGLEARLLFSYFAEAVAFPMHDFLLQMEPQLSRQREEFAGVEWPREGVGCWHPVFPARYDEVLLLAAESMTHLGERVGKPVASAALRVFERRGA